MGIAVGVCVAVLVIVGLVFFLRRRRNQRKPDEKSPAQEFHGMAPSVELHVEQALTSELPAERMYQPLVELETPENLRKTLNAPK